LWLKKQEVAASKPKEEASCAQTVAEPSPPLAEPEVTEVKKYRKKHYDEEETTEPEQVSKQKKHLRIVHDKEDAALMPSVHNLFLFVITYFLFVISYSVFICNYLLFIVRGNFSFLLKRFKKK
jgi:hypothetical protein